MYSAVVAFFGDLERSWSGIFAFYSSILSMSNKVDVYFLSWNTVTFIYLTDG
jgi:hypothetical protein